MMVRKQAGNPADYFDKTFAEYKEGFAANGESWLGLDNLHRLTSQHPYKLKIILTDWDGKKEVAFYDQFQVGPGGWSFFDAGYVLTIGGFNESLSTLGDSMSYDSGMKFSTKDRNLNPDRDIFNCARERTGGWWYNAACTEAHLTGMHTETEWSRIEGSKQLYWWFRGEKGDTHNSFAEVEMLLLPN